LGGNLDGREIASRKISCVAISGDGTTVALGTNSSTLPDHNHVSVMRYDLLYPGALVTGPNPYPVLVDSNYSDPGTSLTSGSITVDTMFLNMAVRGLYYVFYYWKNTSSNITVILKRAVRVAGPLITVNNAHVKDYLIGSAYIEYGATPDGGETITIDSSSLDMNTIGFYDVTYSATDLYSLTTSEVRTVGIHGSVYYKMGQDIDGEAVDDWSGRSVSLSSDGTRVAIGAYGNDGAGRTTSGHTRIYEWNNSTTTWVQMGQNIQGEASSDQSGWSVSLSSDGTRVAIGARYNDGNGGNDSGHTRVYEWNSGTSTWTQMGQDIDGEARSDISGWSVSLSSDGTRVAIGAIYNDGNGTSAGHTRIYEWNSGTSTWTQMGQDIDGEAAYDESGWSVSLSSDGTRVAIGARSNDGNDYNAGHTRIWEWNSGTSTWTQMGQDIDGEARNDYAGYSVSLSSDGTRVAIGAPFNDGNGVDSGHTRVYEWNSGTSTWTQMGQDIDGEAAYDNSGYSVSLSSDGTRVAIGANQNDGNGTSSGHVRVYEWAGARWRQISQDIDGEAASDESGYSVSLSSDGTRVAIGAPFNDGNGGNSGQTSIWEYSSLLPVITLIGNNPYYVGKGTSYVDPGATSDGGETVTVYTSNLNINQKGTYAVDYGAINSYNLMGVYSRYVIVTAPTLTLTGDQQVYVLKGSTYIEQGATSDNGEIITITSNLDTNTYGSYEVNYSATDVNGGVGTVSRYVDVLSAIINQMGQAIYGDAAYDYLTFWSGGGIDMNSDGSRVVVGAGYNDANGTNSGVVRVYEWNSVTSLWSQLGVDLTGGSTNQYFGLGVAMSDDGTRIVVGAPQFSNGGGAVYVYQYSNGSWNQIGNTIVGPTTLNPSGWSAEWGYHVSISGDGTTIAFSDWYKAVNNIVDAGAVRVYYLSGSTWTQKGSDIDGVGASDYFARSISLSYDGSRVAGGAHRSDANGTDSGSARVFEWSGSAWIKMGQTIQGGAVDDRLGYSVSLSSDGTRLAAGAYRNDDGGTNSGHTHIYEWNNSTTTWVQMGQDIDGEAANDYSGISVRLSSDGTRVVIGAPYNDANGTNSGLVRVYDWNSGTSTWTKLGHDLYGDAPNISFGASVAISGDGSRLALGAQHSDVNGRESGSARMFEIFE
jgi:hypothetical protein